MLIKYKTEPTIIVLSPNSANLIKILTQFVYSINIRYFSPSSPVFCTAKYRGGVRRTEGLTLIAKKFMKSFQPLSSIWLTKHLVRLRDTAGEKG